MVAMLGTTLSRLYAALYYRKRSLYLIAVPSILDVHGKDVAGAARSSSLLVVANLREFCALIIRFKPLIILSLNPFRVKTKCGRQ